MKINYLNNYEKIAGKEIIQRIKKKAKLLDGKHIINISSTYQGGGVAEILNSIIFLFNKENINIGWRILHGDDRFFNITKKIHNALQGEEFNFSNRKKIIYYNNNKRYSYFTHIVHDLVVVHDPQPLAMIDFYKKTQPWVFRCHIDITNPYQKVWNYLKQYINKYDHIVLSNKNYIKNDLSIPNSIIYPAIDPLSNKNKQLSNKNIETVLKKHNINIKKPIISQISRFDKWKDPLGVIKIFEKVRKEKNCQLILLGSFASDDPEGFKLFEKVKKTASKSKYKKDIKIIAVDNSILVNVLQKISIVVIQKSLKEGFGLTVSEAMYKGTCVIASNVGGIPLQIINKETGFLCEPNDIDDFSKKTLLLMKNKKLREKIGKNAKEHIKNNFLMTRLMEDWLDLFIKFLIKKNN
jgi:trehalose synthase